MFDSILNMLWVLNILFCFHHLLYQLYLDVFKSYFQCLDMGLLDPKHFCGIPFQNLVFLVSLYPEFLEKKKQRNEREVDFQKLLNPRCFCYAFHANLMSDGKKEKT